MRTSRRRALATTGLACLAGLAIAGCGANSSSSSSSSVTTVGHTLTIVISEPQGSAGDPVAADVVDAEQLAFTQLRGEVKDFNVAVVTFQARTPSENARAAIIYPSSSSPNAIAYLGEVAPGVSDQTVGITNALDLLQVSPTDNGLELSQVTPAVSGSPKTYFQSWGTYGRTFARIVPSADAEARVQVAEMKSLGVGSLYVASDRSDYGRAISYAVAGYARKSGISLTSSLPRAAAIFEGAQSPAAAARFFDHAAAVAPSAKLFGPSSLNSGLFTAAISPSVHNLYVSIPGYLPKDLTAAGKAFEAAFRARYGHAPNVVAIFGYAAMAAVLRVIQREGASANNRTAVIGGFMGQRKVASVLGPYSIDSGGNTSLDAFVFARMRGGKLTPFVAAPTG